MLAAISGFFVPLMGTLNVPAYIAAMIFAVATPLAFLAVVPKSPFRRNRTFRLLFVATFFSAVCAGVTSGMLLSLGSLEGAAGDIGGFPLWLLSTGALVTVTSLAVRAKGADPAGTPTTLRDLQRRERRKRYS